MYVLDTNVIVAGLRSRNGASFRLLNLAIEGRLPIAVSVALALEYEAVLFREAHRQVSWATDAELEAILDALLASANLVTPINIRLRPASPDPADDMIIECAVEAGARAIVSMNQRDFRGVRQRFGIEVWSPGALWRSLDEAARGEGGFHP